MAKNKMTSAGQVDEDRDTEVDETNPLDDKETTYPLPLLGTCSLQQIREAYPQVEEDITDKNYLVKGFVAHSLRISGSEFSIRTLRRREQDALTSTSLSAPADSDLSEFLDSQIYTLVVSLQAVNETKYSAPSLSRDNIDTWKTAEPVVQIRDFIREWDSSMVELLIAAQKELEYVKAIFQRENLKNL